jgi:hypothetical protein
MIQFKKSEQLSKSDMAHLLGGSQLIKQAIQKIVVTRARELVKSPSFTSYSNFTGLLEDPSTWGQNHYRQLSCMLDVPVSTLRYYFEKGETLKDRNKDKLCAFLECDDWQKLEEKAVIEALRQGLGT